MALPREVSIIPPLLLSASLTDGSCSLSTGEFRVEWPRFRSLKADASSTPPLLAIANLSEVKCDPADRFA